MEPLNCLCLAERKSITTQKLLKDCVYSKKGSKLQKIAVVYGLYCIDGLVISCYCISFITQIEADCPVKFGKQHYTVLTKDKQLAVFFTLSSLVVALLEIMSLGLWLKNGLFRLLK